MKAQAKSKAVGVAEVPKRERVSQWPKDVPFNARILSAWGDSCVRVRDDTGAVRASIWQRCLFLQIVRWADHSMRFTLGQFPHWMDTARAYLALSLNEYSGHGALGSAINGLNHVLRFFAWCVEQRVYKLSELRPQDLEAFAVALRPEWVVFGPFDARAVGSGGRAFESGPAPSRFHRFGEKRRLLRVARTPLACIGGFDHVA